MTEQTAIDGARERFAELLRSQHELTGALRLWQGWARRADVQVLLRLSTAAQAGFNECVEKTQEVLGG